MSFKFDTKELHQAMQKQKQNMLSQAAKVMRNQNMLSEASKVIRSQIKSLYQ
jgi:hypothetical protein